MNDRGVLKEKYDIALNNEKAVKRIQYTQHLINHLNQRWQKEYFTYFETISQLESERKC